MFITPTRNIDTSYNYTLVTINLIARSFNNGILQTNDNNNIELFALKHLIWVRRSRCGGEEYPNQQSSVILNPQLDQEALKHTVICCDVTSLDTLISCQNNSIAIKKNVVVTRLIIDGSNNLTGEATNWTDKLSLKLLTDILNIDTTVSSYINSYSNYNLLKI